MIRSPLYHEIAEAIRQAIFYGELKPGDELPPVRDMSLQWNCAPGTVQRAYGLDFVFLTSERYDLVIPEPVWALEPVRSLTSWLLTTEARALFPQGYDTRETGRVSWVE